MNQFKRSLLPANILLSIGLAAILPLLLDVNSVSYLFALLIEFLVWVLTLGILGFVFTSQGEKTIANACWSSALVVFTLFLSVMAFRMLG